MKIAQVAPLYESVPPKGYGGTERIVSYLTEELIRQGHEVTLFASGDSNTAAELIAPTPRSLRLNEETIDHLAHHILLLEEVFRQAARFDIIHFHIDYLHFPLSRRQGARHVTTLHGRLDIPDLVPLYREYTDMPLISISEHQRRPLPDVLWKRTVYHGIPEDLYSLHEQPGDYLAFLGRISSEKGVDRAIDIAERVGMTLKIAAKVDPVDQEYFETTIEPLLDKAHVDFIGEIDDGQKNEFLGNAKALLLPIEWPEPFGLVMIEAMACGTPTIAYRNGSVPEVIRDGISGFAVENADEAVEALGKLDTMDRRACRRNFDERFTCTRMARDYVEAYEELLSEQPRPAAVDHPA